MMTPSFHSSGLSTTNRNRAFTKAGGGADRLVDQYYTTNVLTSGGGGGVPMRVHVLQQYL